VDRLTLTHKYGQSFSVEQFKGKHDNTTPYKKNDVVTQNDEIFIALEPSWGEPPPSKSWYNYSKEFYSKKGEKGDKGDDADHAKVQECIEKSEDALNAGRQS